MDHRETTIKTWNHLRFRILEAHPRRRSAADTLVALDAEFVRLARGLLKLQVRGTNYRIIGVNHYPLARGYIMAKSRDGFVVNIHEKDYELFQEWANLPPEEKRVSVRRSFVIGGTGYESWVSKPNV